MHDASYSQGLGVGQSQAVCDVAEATGLSILPADATQAPGVSGGTARGWSGGLGTLAQLLVTQATQWTRG